MKSRSRDGGILPALRRRVLSWRDAWSLRRGARGLPAVVGEVTVALCHPSATSMSPPLRTVFRKGPDYRAFEDVEIRGFLDGEVKFERSVSTQYHVRVGCEGSKPVRGRYEVMRVLERWDVSSLPSCAQISAVRLVLHQEDCSQVRHRYGLRWPVDFYVYEVRKPWGPGRGGLARDNLSRPERGDAWWLEAKAGELRWTEPGCGYGSDTSAEADRAASPLAWARLTSPEDDLCFSGTLLAAHVERSLRRGGTLDLLIKASDNDEELPGSVKTFFSGEFGDDLNPRLRPELEVEWTAPCLAVERRPFVLEPGTSMCFRPSFADSCHAPAGSTLAVSMDLQAAGTSTASPPPAAPDLSPEVHAVDWRLAGALQEPASTTEWRSVLLPLHGEPGPSFQVRLSTAVNPVRVGESVTIRILETWAPAASTPEALKVRFRLRAPSGRVVDLVAKHCGEYVHALEFQPDELGIWEYSWRTRPDDRFEEQRGGGFFTVTVVEPAACIGALIALTEETIEQASVRLGALTRRRSRYRLTSLQRELHSFLKELETRDPEGSATRELRGLVHRIGSAMDKGQ